LPWLPTFAIARQDARQNCLPEVNLGVLPGTGGTQRLFAHGRKSKADRVDGHGEHFLCLKKRKNSESSNDIFDRDGFMENIMEYARQFCPPNKAARRGANQARRSRPAGKFLWESALAVERENQQLLLAQSEDAKEGLGRIRRKTAGSIQSEINGGRLARRRARSPPPLVFCRSETMITATKTKLSPGRLLIGRPVERSYEELRHHQSSNGEVLTQIAEASSDRR